MFNDIVYIIYLVDMKLYWYYSGFSQFTIEVILPFSKLKLITKYKVLGIIMSICTS